MSLTGIFKAIFNAIFASVAGPLIAKIRTEYAIAKVEMQVKFRELRAGAIMLTVAGVLGFFMLGILLTAAVLGLATVMPGWAAALIVAGVLLIIAVILGLIGFRVLKRGVPPVPTESIESLRRDLRAIKGIGKRGAS